MARRRRRPVVAVLVGSPGIGKTRLLGEATRQMEGEVLWVRGYELERHVSLSATSTLLRRLTATPRWGAMIESLVFAERESAGLPPEPLRIFEAAHRAIHELPCPIVVIDDLQWVDELSLAMCHYLVRAAEADDSGLVVIAGSRPSPGAALFAEATGASLADGERLMRLELEPLPETDGILLARAVSPELSLQAAQELWRTTAGSPFWIETLAGGEAATDPQAVLARRLLSRGPDAASVLATLALAGYPMRKHELAVVNEWDERRAEQAADQLVSAGLAVAVGDRVNVAHDLIREAASRSVPDADQRRIHRLLATYLQKHAHGDLQALLAALEHRQRVGLSCLELGLELARSSQRRLLSVEQLDKLQAVGVAADGPEALELLRAVAALTSDLGDTAGMHRWAALAAREADPAHRATALLAASKAAYRHAIMRSDPDFRVHARAYLEEAKALVQPDDEPFLAQLEAHEGEVLAWLEHRAEEAHAVATRAVGRTGASEGTPARMAALEAAFHIAVLRDDHGALLATARELVASAAEQDDANLNARTTFGLALRLAGRRREAEAVLRPVWSEAQDRLLLGVARDAGYWLARTLYELGHLGEAEAIAAEADRMGLRAGRSTPSRTMIQSLRNLIQLTRGRWQDALRDLADVIAGERDPHYRLNPRAWHCLWAARFQGGAGAKEVIQQLEAAEADLRSAGCSRCRTEVMVRGAEALARVGLDAEAEARLARWAAADATPEPFFLLVPRWVRSLVAARRGDFEWAAREYEAVAEQAEEVGMTLEAVWARLDLAQCLLSTDRQRAAATYRDAAQRASAMGAHSEQHRAEQGLRRLGTRTWRRGRALDTGAGAALTAREAEVAQLAAAGALNPEIAAALFLSRKTVERHLSNVFAKLGVRNRAELAHRLRGGNS